MCYLDLLYFSLQKSALGTTISTYLQYQLQSTETISVHHELQTYDDMVVALCLQMHSYTHSM